MITWPKIPNLFPHDPKGKLITDRFRSPYFEYLKDVPWVWTEKIDGTNIRVIWDGYDLSYKGRKEKSQIPEFLLQYLKDLFEPKKPLIEELFGQKKAVLFGEGYGVKINRNRYKLSDNRFILFGAWVEGFFLDEIYSLAEELELEAVPEVGEYCIESILGELPSFMESAAHPGCPAEGLVGFPAVEPRLYTKEGVPLMVKILFDEFRKQR